MLDPPSPSAGPVAVVDPDVSDYDSLITPDLRRSLRVRFFDTGREALRNARLHRTAAWIVSVELPDMSGFDLVEMLRDKLHSSLIWMVAARYRAEDEVRAYRSGATMYACKPLDARWLEDTLRGCLERTQTLSRSIFN